MSKRGSVFLLASWYLGILPAWPLDLGFNPGGGPNSNVLALAVQPDDSILVGGLFTEFDGVPRNGIVKLYSDGHVDGGFVVNADLISSVSSIAIQQDGKLLLASTILGPGSNYIARVNLDGSPDGTFAAAVDGPVHVVATGPDGAIWIGGRFTEVNGVLRNRVAKLSTTGSVDPGFDPGLGISETVATLLPEVGGGVTLEGFLYASFATNVGRILRLDTNGSASSGFGAGVSLRQSGQNRTNFSVHCLARQADGGVVFAGDFAVFDDVNSGYSLSVGLGRLRSSGLIDSLFSTGSGIEFGTRGVINSILLEPSGRIILGGNFEIFSGAVRPYLVRLFPDGGLDDCFANSPDSTPNGAVHTVARQSTGRVLIGGAFTTVGDVPQPFIAALPSEQPPFAPPTLELVPEFGWPRVSVGGNSKITARATSCSGWIRYQWFKNGAEMPNETQASLVFSHPDARHAGHYFVVASNLAGATTSGVVRLDVGWLDVDFDTSNGPLNWSVPQVHSAVRSILALRNGQVLVGGPFLQVEGLDWAHLARLNADGSLDRTFTARPNAPVWAMAEQPDGKVVIAGEFNGVSGQARDRVARLEPDGSLDTNFTVRLGLNGIVRALDFQQDAKIVIGGAFYAPRSGAPLNHNLVRLETNGAIDLTFNPGTNLLATGIGVNHVKAVVLQPDGMVMAGGTFSRTNGSSRDYLARVRPDGSMEPRFGAEPLAGPNGPVYTLARQPGGLTLIGGSFTRVHDVARTNLARLLPSGFVDESFAPPPAPRAGFISTLAADAGGRLLAVYSSLDSLGNFVSSEIFRYDAQGRLDTNYVAPVTIRAQAPAAIYTLVSTESGGTYIGGTFETVDGVIRRRVALLLGDPPGPPIFTTQPLDLIAEPGIDVVVNASVTMSAPTSFQWYRNGEAIPDGTNPALVISYAMPVHSGPHWLVASNIHGATTSAVALVTIRDPQRPGAVDLSFVPDPGANSNVWALAETEGGQLVIGGDFTQVDRTDVTQIARLNADGRLDDGFRPVLYPLNGARATVRALFPKLDGTLIVGGDFRVTGDFVSSAYLCKLDATGIIDPSFSCGFEMTFTSNPGFPPIRAFASNGNELFLGGSVFTAGGQNGFRYVLRLDKRGSLDSRFKTDLQGIYNPSALACDSDGQVLAGRFYSPLRLTPSGSPDPSFNVTVSKLDPCPGGTSCHETQEAGHVYQVLVQPDGKPIIAGYFEKVNNSPRRHVARLNPDGSLDSTFLPTPSGLNSFVYALALQPDGKLLLGGTFTNLGPAVRNRIARLNQDGSLDESFDLGDGANAEVRSILLLKDGRIAIGGGFTRFNGYPRGRVAVLHGGPVEAPTIGSATNIGIVAGHTLKLVPHVGGYPPPTLQWLFNGIPITHETNLVLQSAGVQAADAGIYSLVVSNSLGVSTGVVATVIVDPPPLEGGFLDPGFLATGGTDGDVHSIVMQQNGRLLIGGSFQHVHGVARAGIARLFADGSLDHTFDPGSALSEMPSNSIRISRIVQQTDGRILAGGNFSVFDGVARGGFVRLNTNGSLDLDFPDVGGWPLLVQPDGKILMGGNETYLKRLHPDGSVDASFDAGTNIDNIVRAAALHADGRIVVIGSFTKNVSQLMPDGTKDPLFDRATRFFEGSTIDPCFGVGADGSAGSQQQLIGLAVQPDGRILIGGYFGASASATIDHNLIRLLPSGAADPDFNQWGGPGFAVRSVAVQRDGRVLIGGCFTNVAPNIGPSIGPGVPRDHIARLNSDGSVDPTFSPGAGYANSGDGWVGAIALQPDGRIVLGGQFSHVDGVRRNNIARLGGDVQMFDPATDGQTFTTRIATVEGRSYWLEAKATLSDGEWTVVANVAGDGSVKTLTDAVGGTSPRFYRVRAE